MVPEVIEEPETQLVIVNTAPSASLMQPVGSVDDAQLPEGVFSLSGKNCLFHWPAIDRSMRFRPISTGQS